MPDTGATLTMLSVWGVSGYLAGSIPFGLLVTRVFGLGDVRGIGSGNIGASNVLRTGSRSAAALTLLLDGGKGAAAVLLARMFYADESAVQLTALAAVLGHCFPVWLGFRGGKGVATFFGVWLALAWPAALCLAAVWLVPVTLTRISSAGALAASVLSPAVAWLLVSPAMAGLAVPLAGLVVWRHRENIARILAGTENRF